MKIAVGADHGGFDLKERLRARLIKQGFEVLDAGCHDKQSVDYPDYAAVVARQVSEGDVDQGLLVCTTGIGMSIVANKFPRVRAALCTSVLMARMARTHNHANILALGGQVTDPDTAEAILDEWLQTRFTNSGRHARRVRKMAACMASSVDPVVVSDSDPELYSALRDEARRQRENLELIASENYASRAVREACGSVLTNKYAEGYPGKRWYHGCAFVDQAEQLAIDRARQVFGAEHVNVQPHSGSQANMAVYFAALEPGATIMAMSLADGGHLTHGHPVNFSGRFFRIVPYGVSRDSEIIDYDQVQQTALKEKPRMIVAGASAYSRLIDFQRLRRIADAVGALFMVDMAHIAGLVAAGCHPSPVPYADFVTTTTHKTLRGPRGGLILCRKEFAQAVDKQVFPGIQGGPLMNTIAAKAVCLQEALQPEFSAYQHQVVQNARVLAEALSAGGARIVSGGTDNHLMLVDLKSLGLTGKDAAAQLDQAGITVNKNAIPFDERSPFVTSGIRVGTPAVTSRGMGAGEMTKIATWILDALRDGSSKHLQAVRSSVRDLTARFPVP